jgi:hypothetical protein
MFMTVYIVYSMYMYIELYMYVHYIIRRHSSMDMDVHVASIIKLLCTLFTSQPHSLTSPYIQMYTPTKDVGGGE